jgi:hypothetical protein
MSRIMLAETFILLAGCVLGRGRRETPFLVGFTRRRLETCASNATRHRCDCGSSVGEQGSRPAPRLRS